MIVKGTSKRLPGKNLKDFNGKPMFVWNLEKCLSIFKRTFVSSDDDTILSIAEKLGAIAVKRPTELCGDVPDIPVYLHAWKYMGPVTGLVAVHADTPLVEPGLIQMTKDLVEIGCPEVMTCHPMARERHYKDQHCKIYGSVRGMTSMRLVTYGDPHRPQPSVMLVDSSIEIEDEASYQKALWLSRPR